MKKKLLINDLVKLAEFGIAIRDKEIIRDALKKLAEWCDMYVVEDRTAIRGMTMLPPRGTIYDSLMGGSVMKVLRRGAKEWRAARQVSSQ